jgi:hypothetical protein
LSCGQPPLSSEAIRNPQMQRRRFLSRRPRGRPHHSRLRSELRRAPQVTSRALANAHTPAPPAPPARPPELQGAKPDARGAASPRGSRRAGAVTDCTRTLPAEKAAKATRGGANAMIVTVAHRMPVTQVQTVRLPLALPVLVAAVVPTAVVQFAAHESRSDPGGLEQ